MSWPADPPRTRLVAALLVGAACLCAGRVRADWSFPVSTGYDLYIHDYYLSEVDTTEVIQEFNVVANANGASPYGARHRWFLRAALSGGTELYRETLDTGFRLRSEAGQERLRGELTLLARQFREGSTYSLSSDNSEGRAILAATPWTNETVALQLRGRGRFVDYAQPSTLEVDYTDGSAGVYLRAPSRALRDWSLGGVYGARSYPDSNAINRRGFILEGDYDHGSLDRTLRAFHRSERRNIEDETARPSAWFHWSELDTAHPAGEAEIILRGRSEVWDYDQATGAWYDSWLVGAQAGARWGDPFRARFETLLTTQHLEAGDEPETFWQAGLRFGAETMSATLSGSASIELGQRWYTDVIATTDAFVLAYSDYSYLALWLMGNWNISEHFSADITANFEPENHTEQQDDITLGFASLRLVWRP